MSNKRLTAELILSTIDKASAPLKKIMGGSSQTAKALKQAKDQLAGLQEQQSQLKSFKKLQKATAESSERYREAAARANDLKRQLESTTGPTKRLEQQFNKSVRTARKYKNAHSQNRTELHQLGRKLRDAKVDTSNLANAERLLEHRAKKTTRGLKEQEAQLKKLAWQQKRLNEAKWKYQRTQRLAGDMASTGAGALGAGAAGGAAFMAPVMQFASSESASTNLKVAMMLSDGSIPKEFEKINKLAERLGNKLPGTTADFKNMMTMLKRQGMSAQGILEGLGKATAYIAVQLKMPYEAAAEFSAKLQDATGTTERDMMGLMDVIQRTSELGVVPESMLQAFTKLSPAMAMIKKEGLEGAKLFAPLVAMADQAGMAGEAAGNAYRKILQRAMDTNTIGKALQGTGMNLTFTDGQGEFAGLDNVFAQLKKLKELDTETRMNVIKDIWGDDAETQQALGLLIKKGKAGYEETIAKMKAQADLQQRVNAQLGTLTNLWDAASGTFINGLVMLAETISPELKSLTEWLGEMAVGFGEWIDNNRALVRVLMFVLGGASALLVTFGALALATSALLGPFAMLRWTLTALGIKSGLFSKGAGLLGGVLLKLRKAVLWVGKTARVALGKSLLWIGKTVLPMLAKAILWVGKTALVVLGKSLLWIGKTVLPMLGKAILWVGRAFLMNPIGLAVTAIAGAAYLIYKNWAPIKQFFAGLWDGVKSVFDISLGEVLATLVNWSPWGIFYSAIQQGLAKLGVDLPAKFSEFGGNLISGLIGGITAKFAELKSKVTEIGSSVSGWFKEKLGINSPSRVFASHGSDVLAGLQEGLSDQRQVLKPVDTLSKRLKQAGAGLTLGAVTAAAAAQPLPDVQALARYQTDLSPVELPDLQAVARYRAEIQPTSLPDIQRSERLASRIDKRPPLSVGQAATPIASGPITITINAAPGMNEQALAQLVARELERIQAGRAAARRSNLRDED